MRGQTLRGAALLVLLLLFFLGLSTSETPGTMRRLLQKQAWTYGNATSDNTYALVESVLPRVPQEWDRNVSATDDLELRAAICRSQGGGMADVDTEDPMLGCKEPPNVTATPAPTMDLTGINLDNIDLDLVFATPAPTIPFEPSSVEVTLAADMRLDGIPLPEIIGQVKINGTCHHQRYRANRPCRIFAVDERCCKCSSPSPVNETCQECRKGMETDTQPFKIAPGGRLWLYNIEICAGRTTMDGGSLVLQPGSANASWFSNSAEEVSFLHAEDVRFTKGYADGRGGTLAVKTGGVAVLIRPEFKDNFAASSADGDVTSHDVDVEGGGAVILYQADPEAVDMHVDQSLEPGALDGEFYVRYVPPPPPMPPMPPSPAPPPPDVLKELIQAEPVDDLEPINVTDLDRSSSGTATKINLPMVIGIGCGAILAVAIAITACCLLKKKPKRHYSSTALKSPGKAENDDPSVDEVTSFSEKPANHETDGKSLLNKATPFSGDLEDDMGEDEISALGHKALDKIPSRPASSRELRAAWGTITERAVTPTVPGGPMLSGILHTRPVSSASSRPGTARSFIGTIEEAKEDRIKIHDAKVGHAIRTASARRSSFKNKQQITSVSAKALAPLHMRAASAPPKRPPKVWGGLPNSAGLVPSTSSKDNKQAPPSTWGFLPPIPDEKDSGIEADGDPIQAVSWMPPPDPDFGYFTTNLFNMAKTRASGTGTAPSMAFPQRISGPEFPPPPLENHLQEEDFVLIDADDARP